jgi:ABC-type nitrate/sulfonate/bicarbonate transport system substrate-binding protein
MICGPESKPHRRDKYMSINNAFGKLLMSFVLLLGVSVSHMSCQDQRTSPKVARDAKESVTIGIATQALSAPLIIAQEKGYFSDEGLNVTVKEYPFGKIALEAMFTGEVDLATVAETPIVMNSFKRADFSIIALFVYSYDDPRLVVRKDRGIKKAVDLKGRKIGVTIGTAAQFLLDSYLNHYGLVWSDVKIVNISVQDLPAALKNGEVDAIVVPEPYGYEALKLLKNKAMRMPKAEIFRETFNLTAMKEFHGKHPETVNKALKAIDKAIAFIKQNKGESIAVLVKRLNMDEKYLYDDWDDYVFGLSLDQALLISLEDVANWALKNRSIDRKDMPNYLDFIYFDGLQSVKPEAVRIIR